MGKVKDSLMKEEIGEAFLEETIKCHPMSFYDIALLPKIDISNIFFRNMSVGLNEIIGRGSSDERKSTHLPPKEITVMTFTIGTSFSNDVLEIIKNSADKVSLTVVFCYTYQSIADICKAFEKIFKIKNNLKISVIANPHTHIKMLQIDDSLYTGSMNYSSSADAIDKKNYKENEVNHNHELLFHFNKGGHAFAKQLREKIKGLPGSVSFEIDQSDYSDKLKENLSGCNKMTLSSVKGLKESIKKEINEKYREKITSLLPYLIREQVSISFKNMLNIRDDIKLLNETISYCDLLEIVSYFRRNDEGVIIDSFIKMPNSAFIIHCDDDDDGQNFKNKLCDIINDKKEVYFDSLILDESKIREEILNERYDDNGEGDDVPWGNNSENEYEKYIETNKKEIIYFLNGIFDEITKCIYDGKYYDSDFFFKII